MRKLGKEEIQKITLVVIFFIILIYLQRTLFIAPARAGIARAEKEIATLESQLQTAEKQFRNTRSIAARRPKAEDEIAYFQSLSEPGAPIAWFPPMITKFFERFGIKNATARMASSSPFSTPGLSAFNRVDWSIQVPNATIDRFGFALAALENAQPLYTITHLQIYAGDGGNSAEFQRINFALSTYIEKD
jgi:hypothetical protein